MKYDCIEIDIIDLTEFIVKTESITMRPREVLRKLTEYELDICFIINYDKLITFILEHKCMELLKYMYENTTFVIYLKDIFARYITKFNNYTEKDLPFIEDFFTFIFNNVKLIQLENYDKIYNIDTLYDNELAGYYFEEFKNNQMRMHIYKILLVCIRDCYLQRRYDYATLDIFCYIPLHLNDNEMFLHMYHFYKKYVNEFFNNGEVLNSHIVVNDYPYNGTLIVNDELYNTYRKMIMNDNDIIIKSKSTNIRNRHHLKSEFIKALFNKNDIEFFNFYMKYGDMSYSFYNVLLRDKKYHHFLYNFIAYYKNKKYEWAMCNNGCKKRINVCNCNRLLYAYISPYIYNLGLISISHYKKITI